MISRAPLSATVLIHGETGTGKEAIARALHDGSERADRCLERVLTSDPGMGVIRHADAGYQRAIDCARDRGVVVPRQRDAEGEGATDGEGDDGGESSS